MESYRDKGPAYPTEPIDEFATITIIRDCGINNEDVISCPPSELPADFPWLMYCIINVSINEKSQPRL